jgi:predicted TIM-barrel fold metal-dependent hydrolase
LRRTADRWPIKGYTHYLRNDDDGSWLHSKEGLEFFRVASERQLISSIAGSPHHQPAIRKVAAEFPTMPILCHHLAGVSASEGPPHDGLKQVLESARIPNIYIKVSGFYYGSNAGWEYPHSDALWVVRALYEHFGPYRMCWGSDYPVCRRFVTYRQTLEVFRGHCTFVPDEDKSWILGDTLSGLLGSQRGC